MKLQRQKGIPKIVWICLFSILFFPKTVMGAEKGYFENPEEIYKRFRDRIYHESCKVEYGFLREGEPIYSDFRGSKQIGKAARYSGVMVVSKTESYLQVIYETKTGYGIGWMDRSRYREISRRYDGSEKQLLADGTYEMTNSSTGEVYQVELIFQKNQQYLIRDTKTQQVLDLKKKKKKYVAEPGWSKESDSESQHWELIREYDHFYLKNKMAGRYLADEKKAGMKLLKTDVSVKNQFGQEKEQESQKIQWTFRRISGKNVNPYRNFVQYDPDWSRENYGNVKDYSGKMAAAGCGVVAITNAVYALNGQFIDPMLLADFAVEKEYRIIGSGTDDGVFKAAAKEFGAAYDFYYIKTTYDTFEMRDYLKQGCVAISHVPGHYVTVADYKEKNEKYLVLDSHPIPARPTTAFGDWFQWERLETGGLATSGYYIYGTKDVAEKIRASSKEQAKQEKNKSQEKNTTDGEGGTNK